MKFFIYPYTAGSGSVNGLKEALGVKSIRRDNSSFVGDTSKTVVNWGCSKLPDEVLKSKVINMPEKVKLASNKLNFFQLAGEELNIPEFTQDIEEAKKWSASGNVVISRTKLNGHSGDGIFVHECIEDFNNFDHTNVLIYVKYIPKKEEYRVHVCNGKVIDVQRKAKRKDMHPEDVNYRIRSHKNGFVFIRGGITPDPQVMEQAVKAVEITGLDFGAVDVIWNEYRKKAYVLEINTAPGLEGTTLKTYSKALAEMVVDYSTRIAAIEKQKIWEDNFVEPPVEDVVPVIERRRGHPYKIIMDDIFGVAAE